MLRPLESYSDQELIAGIQASTGNLQKPMLTALWKRYENQVHKHWAVLRKQMNSSSLVMELHDDFYSEAYIAFAKAVEAVDLSKVKDDKWRFVGYFKYYLTNLRTDMINKLLKQCSKEKSFYVDTEDGEVPRADLLIQEQDAAIGSEPERALLSRVEEEHVKTAVNHCMSFWDERRRAIFRLRSQGLAKGEVAVRLGVHPATITYHLQVMQKDLEKELRAI